jgi:AraC-like DNA-binding protein
MDDVLPLPETILSQDNIRLYFDQLLDSPERLPPLHTLARLCGFDTLNALRKACPEVYDTLWKRVHTEQRAVLELALQQKYPVILSKWAQQHGYQTSDLYHHFYALCVQVTERFHTDKQNRSRQYLHSLLESQTCPTLTEICRTLEVGSYFLRQHFADELLTIEMRRKQQIAQDRTFVEATFTRLLSENEPEVSLNQIAEAVGKSVRSLKHRFPTQSRALVAQRREQTARQVKATCDRIHQTVFDLHQQGIYPSVDRIHAVIGSWMVHGKAYRHAYNEAMILCGYLSTPAQ